MLVNPSSGGGSASAQGVAVARYLRDAGAEVTLTYSSGSAHAQRVACEASERGDVVVAVGGDGMVGSIAGEIVSCGGTLGIAPGGRGNDFARQLGIGVQPAEVARALLGTPARKVDAIDIGGHVVVGSVYAGVDSLSSEYVNDARLLPKRLQYPYAALRAIAAYRPASYTVTVDGASFVREACTVVVANSGYYGSGMRVAPGAVIDDGILDVVIIGADSRLRLVRAFPTIYDGSHVESDSVTVLTGREVSIEALSPVMAYGDGEPIAPLPVAIRVLPGALNVIA